MSVDISFASGGSVPDDCMDPANLSIGHSEVSLEGLNREHSSREEEVTDNEDLLPPRPQFFHEKAKTEDGMGSMSSRMSTPLERSDSHMSTSPDCFDFTSPVALRRSSSPRDMHVPKAIQPGQELTQEVDMSSPRASPAFISRQGVNGNEAQQSCPLRTSFERRAPSSESDAPMDEDEYEDARTESDRAQSPPPVPPSLSREKNYTHDGVMELDPEPQPIDPPRPDPLMRAHSDVDELPLQTGSKSAFLGIQMEFGGGAFDGMSVFGRGSRQKQNTAMDLGDVSALDRLMENAAQGSTLSFPHLRIRAPLLRLRR